MDDMFVKQFKNRVLNTTKMKITLITTLALLSIKFSHAQCDDALFEEQNGIAVVEMESGNVTSSWIEETGTANFTGDAYIAWRGSNYFNSPGNGILEYKVKINNPGTYRFRWRNNIGVGSSTTDNNDSWLKFPDADDFYGERGTSIVYPAGSGKTPNPNGASSNGWFKIYANALAWNWTANTSDRDPHAIYAVFNSAGVYTIQVSARSNGHFIDRMVLYNEDLHTSASATSLTRGETLCDDSTPPDPDPEVEPKISFLELIDADSDEVISDLTNNMEINVSEVSSNLSVNAIPENDDVSSVTFDLNGPVTTNRTENTAPYALFGGPGTNFTGMDFSAGDYTLKVTPYSERNATGESGDSVTINFTVVEDDEVDCTTLMVTLNEFDDVKENDASFILTGGSPSGGSYSGQGVTDNRFDPSSVGPGTYTIVYSYTDPVTQCFKSPSRTITVTENTTSSDLEIDFLEYINGTTGEVLGALENGTEINLNTIDYANLAISASVSSTDVASVRFSLSGPLSYSQTENVIPYSLFGDFNNVLNSKDFPVGNYQLNVIPYTGRSATGTAGQTTSISFSVVDYDTTTSSLVVVNSITDQDAIILGNGTSISSALAENINIRLETSLTGIGSVGFELSGTTSVNATENIAPYAIFGDQSGNYRDGEIPSGNYSLTATLYSGRSLSGSVLEAITVSFSVSSNAATTAKIYPNPVVGDTFSIELANTAEEVYYMIINSSGLQVSTGSLKTNHSDVISVPVSSSLSPGVYYITTYSNGTKQTSSFIKS